MRLLSSLLIPLSIVAAFDIDGVSIYRPQRAGEHEMVS